MTIVTPSGNIWQDVVTQLGTGTAGTLYLFDSGGNILEQVVAADEVEFVGFIQAVLDGLARGDNLVKLISRTTATITSIAPNSVDASVASGKKICVVGTNFWPSGQVAFVSGGVTYAATQFSWVHQTYLLVTLPALPYAVYDVVYTDSRGAITDAAAMTINNA